MQLSKVKRIEEYMRKEVVQVFRPDCSQFSPANLRKGVFLCHRNPTQSTYRSSLVNPFPTTNSSSLVGIIQSWVSTNPVLALDGLLVRVNPHCPTRLASLGDSECELEDRAGADMSARINEVLSVCAVRELEDAICTA